MTYYYRKNVPGWPNRTITGKFVVKITIIDIDILEESTRGVDNGYTKCTITTSAIVELEMSGMEITDSGSSFTTITCRNNLPTSYTDYSSDWQLRLEQYTLIVDGKTIIKDKQLPIKSETLRVGNTDYVITYTNKIVN